MPLSATAVFAIVEAKVVQTLKATIQQGVPHSTNEPALPSLLDIGAAIDIIEARAENLRYNALYDPTITAAAKAKLTGNPAAEAARVMINTEQRRNQISTLESIGNAAFTGMVRTAIYETIKEMYNDIIANGGVGGGGGGTGNWGDIAGDIADQVDLQAVFTSLLAMINAIGQPVYNGVLTGAINGTNQDYTTAFNYVTRSTRVYLNTSRQVLDVDYTENGTNGIHFIQAPMPAIAGVLPADKLTIDYTKA